MTQMQLIFTDFTVKIRANLFNLCYLCAITEYDDCPLQRQI